jgi:Uma2 family endonuclease
MSTAPQWMTAQELLDLPRDDMRHELVRGELRTMSPGGRRHGRIAVRFCTPLDVHVTSRGLGEVYTAETGYRLAHNPDTVRAPDVSFVRAERLPHMGNPDGYLTGAPDIALEVLSPSDRPGEMAERIRDLMGAGTAILWVVDSRRRTVAEHRPGQAVRVLGSADVLKTPDIVPDWELPLRDLFAGLSSE